MLYDIAHPAQRILVSDYTCTHCGNTVYAGEGARTIQCQECGSTLFTLSDVRTFLQDE